MGVIVKLIKLLAQWANVLEKLQHSKLSAINCRETNLTEESLKRDFKLGGLIPDRERPADSFNICETFTVAMCVCVMAELFLRKVSMFFGFMTKI